MRRIAVLAAVVVAVPAMAVAGCSSNKNDSASSAATTPPSSGTPSPSVSVPSGVDLTAPGTKLAFGRTATVPYAVGKQSAVLALTVKSAVQGTLADFKGFDVSQPYERQGSYFYVRVAVKNVGTDKLGGVPVPLWGISDKGLLLQAVDFKSAFSKCPTGDLPKDFAPKDTFQTCLVYLSPKHGGLTGVSYRPTVDYQPIEWHGKVQPPATSKAKGGSKQ